MPNTLSTLLIVLFIFFDCCYITIQGTQWLALAKLGALASISSRDKCENLYGLSRKQVKICKRNLEVMNSVKKGAVSALSECQWQFRQRRWNCSLVESSHLFGNALNLGSREAAFVHAVSAAGVSYSVTRACSGGHLAQCGCDRSIRGEDALGGFQWFGCSENIAFGNSFSKSFVEAIDRKDRSTNKRVPHSRILMNQHNNKAGRKILEDNMRTECKCHGVSGSCELRTCWKSLPEFRVVGNMLKEKFDGATKVKTIKMGYRRQLVPVNKDHKPHTTSDLVYLEQSPSFCESDLQAGSLGTHGRQCNSTSAAIDGCDLMCCRRGFTTRTEKVVKRCRCKFHWCCYVTCEKCTEYVQIHTCL